MEDISAEEFNMLSKSDLKDYILIDVREELEFHTYNIGGKNIPLGKLPVMIAEDDFDFDKNDTLILICQRGIRSKTAKHILEQNGYQSVRNLSGGLLKLQRLINQSNLT